MVLNPKSGDKLWLQSDREPTNFELNLSNKLKEAFPQGTSVFLSVFSIPKKSVDQEHRQAFLELGSSDTSVFVLQATQGDVLHFPIVRTLFSESNQKTPSVQVSMQEVNFATETLLLVARIASVGDVLGFELSKSPIEIGALLCLLGSNVLKPPIYRGYFSLETHRCVNAELRLQDKNTLDGVSPRFSDLIRGNLDFSDMTTKEKMALALAGKGALSNDALSKWAFYSSALEQLFGKRYKDEVPKFYKSYGQAKDLAKVAVSNLHKLRNDFTHNSLIGDFKEFDESAIQMMVVDGAFKLEAGQTPFLCRAFQLTLEES